MDDEVNEKEARFRKQQEILKRLSGGVDGKFRWRNSNHKIYSHRPSLKPIDRERLKEEAIRSLNELEDL